MPIPPLPRAVRALPRPSRRLIRLRLLVLAAVALPLVASAAAPADVAAPGPTPDVAERVTVESTPARVERAIPVPESVPAPVLEPVPSPAPAPVPVPVPEPVPPPAPDPVERPSDEVWDALARCESNGRWDAERIIDGAVAYSGGLQFAGSTWRGFRPDGFPDLASHATREQQIVVAERVLAVQGWGAWPACSRRLGLR